MPARFDRMPPISLKDAVPAGGLPDMPAAVASEPTVPQGQGAGHPSASQAPAVVDGAPSTSRDGIGAESSIEQWSRPW